ncbi:hypothetical protein DB347_06580 [Opitutaceae bacterium EW11]|nr:hypothetical protein DB347_06580 [Opitutaceae bacterium EW11]
MSPGTRPVSGALRDSAIPKELGGHGPAWSLSGGVWSIFSPALLFTGRQLSIFFQPAISPKRKRAWRTDGTARAAVRGRLVEFYSARQPFPRASPNKIHLSIGARFWHRRC